jgi:hypothetical protein
MIGDAGTLEVWVLAHDLAPGNPNIAVVRGHVVLHCAGDHACSAIDAARGVEEICVLFDLGHA